MQEYKLAKPNRIKKTTPKRGKMWCLGCDRYFVGVAEKCPICGTISDKGKHFKRNEYKDLTIYEGL